MTEKDLELLVTIDDTGEDEVPEIFDHHQTSIVGGNPSASLSASAVIDAEEAPLS
jgi:hypothetical protein